MPPGAKTDNGANFFSTFATGKIGMVGSGAFAIGNLKKSYPNLKFGLAPLPGQTGGSSSFAGGDLIAIPAGSKNVQAAQEFISWCLSADVQVQQFAKNGSIPVRSDLASNEYSKLDTRYVLVSKLMDKGRTPYTLRYNELINDDTNSNVDAVLGMADGKNPGDVWVFPNVKNNHVEKTEHPCQYPVELVERFVLSMSDEQDWVLDPFMGVGSSLVAAYRHGRRGAGAELLKRYVDIARDRLADESVGLLKTRPMNKPVYDPIAAGNSLTTNPWKENESRLQLRLIEQKRADYRKA